MTGNRSGHSLRLDIGFFGTIRLSKYPRKYRGKYLCLSVFHETRGVGSSITSLDLQSLFQL